MKKYIGIRTPPGHRNIMVEDDKGNRFRLRHVVYHSPTGMEWGYGGSGPADTALSILADVLGERPTKEQLSRGEAACWRLHQAFKWAFIAKADRDGFEIREEDVHEWINAARVAQA